jgi:V/A-type H+-transporting ATPase subunit E
MAIEDIVNQIGEDARSEAEAMLSRTKAEADAILEKAKKRAEGFREEAMQKAEERAKEHARRIETLAGLELRKEILKEKKDLIAEAFAKAEDKIASLPSNEYLAFLKPIILAAVESGNEEIIPSQRHREMFTPDFLHSLNSELGFPNASLRLSEDIGDFSGGFILREGKKDTNMTLRSMIDSRRDSLEPEVAAKLFGENNG